MSNVRLLTKQWEELMALCHQEAEFRTSGTHPKILRLVTERIDQLGKEMGFSADLISRREFQAERDGSRILQIKTQ